MTPREIYNTQIAPLITQLDALATQHGFSYLAAVQYSPDNIAESYILPEQADSHLRIAAGIINAGVIWEDET